jgi:hypothetical protein
MIEEAPEEQLLPAHVDILEELPQSEVDHVATAFPDRAFQQEGEPYTRRESA